MWYVETLRSTRLRPRSFHALYRQQLFMFLPWKKTRRRAAAPYGAQSHGHRRQAVAGADRRQNVAHRARQSAGERLQRKL